MCVCGGGGCSYAQAAPNIIFILVDDMGWNGVSCFGNKHLKTPHIDRLAAEGITFTSAYTMSQCTPSRTALLSGQSGARTRVASVEKKSPGNMPMVSPGRSELKHGTRTVFNMLQEAGYATGISGKWHVTESVGYKMDQKPESRAEVSSFGFDYVGDLYSDAEPDKGVMAITDEMFSFIKQNKNKPFAFFLSHYTVHTWLVAPESLVDKYNKL